jgi:hypothetical protein
MAMAKKKANGNTNVRSFRFGDVSIHVAENRIIAVTATLFYGGRNRTVLNIAGQGSLALAERALSQIKTLLQKRPVIRENGTEVALEWGPGFTGGPELAVEGDGLVFLD